MLTTVLTLLVVVTLVVATPHVHLLRHHHDCPDCDETKCPKSGAECSLGLVADACGCCALGVCGLREGEKCFNRTIVPSEHLRFGSCGDNMLCLMRPDLRPHDEPEALCTCKDVQTVCGSNNRTYDSICQLNAEAAEHNFVTPLQFKSWGPCLSIPWIVSAPHDVVNPIHTSLSLDCEVKGYPIPVIQWEFRGEDGATKLLPNDDLYVAIQVRGGPEAYMTTSWVQIVDLRHSDAGTYTCIASNSEGIASASARLTIRN